VSLLVTLYGRIDFMELQLALFCERPSPTTELIYILDDPSLEEAAEQLAFSCWSRFKLPFRLLILPENAGFAAANNAGLRSAAGTFVCLLNSDVFPRPGEGLRWIEPLAAHLERDATLGAVAPRLLYADGTLQHDGMHYEQRPELADWWFPVHAGKGATAGPDRSLRRVAALSGACLMLRRSQLLAYGGLDEAYAIGDFEDADLCQRLAADGKACAVDRTQALYHLERQSQGADDSWRANATLYNAWRFNRRWRQLIDAEAGPR
jgi:GT2 family glycosyltransferase